MIDAQLVAGLTLLALLTVSPGADMALVAGIAVRDGRGPAFVATLGITSGLAVHAIASALGLSLILATSAEAFTVVKLLGAAYLVYLGAQMIVISGRAAPPRGEGPAVSGSAFFIRGLVSNVLNPKVAVFYLTFLPQFISPGEPVLAKSLLFAGAHAAMGVVWLTAYAYGMSYLALRLAAVRPWIERLGGAILVALGLRLAFERR